MASPAVGIAYTFWLRLRWGIIATLVLLISLGITIRVYPSAAFICQPAALLMLFMALAPLLNTFAYGPADIGARASGFPSHMMVLPVSSRALVGWSMLCGTGTIAIFWILVASLIFRSADLLMPVFWPAAMLAAICAWVQAIGWAPVPWPLARVPALAIALTPLIAITAVVATHLDSPPVAAFVTACGLISILVAYYVGVRGLARARRGDEAEWFRFDVVRRVVQVLMDLVVDRTLSSTQARPPFRSAAAAQLWHECRRNAIYLPVMMAFIGVPLLAVNCLAIFQHDSRNALMIGSVAVKSTTLSLFAWLTFPFMFATLLGGGMGKFDIWGKEAMISFFAIRPMSSKQYVAIKLAAIAISVAAACALTLGLMAIWAILEASPLNGHESIVRFALAQTTPWRIFLAPFVVVGVMVAIWRNIADGLWTNLAGRKWFSMSIAFGYMAAITGAAGVGAWIYRHPEVQPTLRALVPWFVGATVLLKLIIVAGVVRALEQRQILDTREVLATFAVWVAVFAGVIGIAWCFTPLTWMIAAIAFLCVPYASLAGALVALHWNRHR